ncbi:MAG: dual specificity protein phosphatase family protein [Phycisphaerales bacterium]|nr:dual specificity protein phosphatase family protein [Phycisphaerales bacterium]
MSPWVRLFMRLQFHPARIFNRVMYRTGRWRLWDWVDEQVLLGGAPTRADLALLPEMGVRGIVNMCEEFHGHQVVLHRLGLQQLHLPTVDFHPPSLEAMQRGLEFIRQFVQAGSGVYVHCKAGQGRSATLVVGYLMAAYGLTPRAAYARVREVRPHVTRRLDEREVVQELHLLLAEGRLGDWQRPRGSTLAVAG